jgi:hypothetical protein
MQPVSRQRIGKYVSAATNTHATIELLLETGCLLLGSSKVVMRKIIGATQLVEGCQLTESSALEAVKIGPERVKLKNIHC